MGEEMSHQGLDVDQLDIAANSPLHLAAKHGHISSVSALLHFGAQVALKVQFQLYVDEPNRFWRIDNGPSGSIQNHFRSYLSSMTDNLSAREIIIPGFKDILSNSKFFSSELFRI